MLLSLGRLCLLSALWSSSVARATSVDRRGPQKGFAKANGSLFEVDGKPFAFVGANSYWLPLLTLDEDIENTFQVMEDAGIKVLRTWGFNAINASELAWAEESKLTYYQVWNGSDWTLNEEENGLKRLDRVIEAAAEHDIKVILAFTNNWVGYGGAELYVDWIAGEGSLHDVFYSDRRIVESYQRYVKVLVERYKDSPTIFAWELMNEARCKGDLASSAACPGTSMLSDWYEEQAAFVKDIDPYHMVTTGGEGHFNWEDPVTYWYKGKEVSDYNFNGQAGEDFDHDLSLENIDFGVYHMYPQFWYGSTLDTPEYAENFTIEQWGIDWINYHAEAAKKANKPVVLEEFGTMGFENKTTIYPNWVSEALKTGHAIMPWQFGMLGLKEDGGNRLIKYADALIDGASPNDNFTYYINQTEVWSVFSDAAEVQNERSG